ncbi:exopolyphosphatase-like protein [Xylariaceae sp. FL1272]|nr:exopolyphosphatase-like protein [Xylariaceae sp. FL1272]
MPPRTSLKQFLASARAVLTAPPSKRPSPLTFVVGNESADLDSLCSALLLAYFQTYTPSSKSGGAESGRSHMHIPVCHLQRADLALRPELAAVLRSADVSGDDLFTFENILPAKDSAEHVIKAKDTEWLLVDHNVMTGRLAKTFEDRVIGCVDHHADEHVVPADAEPRVIEKSGSCASLILERYGDVWDTLAAELTPESKVIDAQIAHLALGPILIDTSNLLDKTKTTAHDTNAVELAESKIAAQGSGLYRRDELFKLLSELKEDLSNMSFRDVFRKDYKEWSAKGLNLATSSVPKSFAYLVDEKAGGDAATFWEELEKWGVEKDEERKMDLVVVFTAFKDEEDDRFCRELLVWARTKAGVEAAKVFESTNKDTLQLNAWEDGKLDLGEKGESESRACWTQTSVEASRKQIAPMLRDALTQVAA